MNIVISLGGVDITDSVIFNDASFTTSAMGVPGSCSFRIKDLNHASSYIIGTEITLDVEGVRTWGGYLMKVHRGYFFDGTPHPCDPLVPMYWTLEGVDYNILLTKRVLHDPIDGRNMLQQFDAGTHDDVVIKYYIEHYTDLLADGISDSGVVYVGTPSTDAPIDGQPGETVLSFLRRMEFNTGAIYYIDPDKVLVYCDVDTPTAPYPISDHPSVGEIGCRDLEILFDGANLRNDAMVWGAGQGSDSIHFQRVSDSSSVANHGRWQVGLFSTAMFRQATIDRTANSYVYGSPQNKRGGKDDAISLLCGLFTPGFRVAQKVTFRSDVFSFTDVIPIRRMTVTFPTPKHPKFQLSISHEIDIPWEGFEFWFPPIPKFKGQIPKIHIPPIGGTTELDKSGILINPADCVGGKVEFVQTFMTDSNGQTYGFDGADTYSMYVDFFATAAVIPTPPPTNYLGGNWYIVDGDLGTVVVGYFAWAGGSIEWDLRIPLPVDGVTIDQGVGAPNDTVIGLYNGPSQGWRRTANGFSLNYLDPATNTWKEAGRSGPYDDGLVRNSITVALDQSITARYWSASSLGSVASYYIGEGKMFGMRGEYGWGLWLNGARLFTRCVTLSTAVNGDIGSGSTAPPAPTPVAVIPPPDGEDPNFCYVSIPQKWVPGSLMVYAAGLYINPNTYTVNLNAQWVRLPKSYCSNTISVYYLALVGAN